MIDLHCHFLPGIDDGAGDMAEALALARAAVDNGIERAIMTPHLHPGRWHNFSAAIEGHTRQFRTALQEADIPLEVGCAAEVRLSPEVPRLIEDGQVPFLGQWHGYRVMLLEFPHSHIPLGADKLVERLLQVGVLPVIAHPERNKDVARDVAKITPFVEMGCILQLTAASVCGRFGERAQRTARDLLASDARLVLATDAHNLAARPPLLREGAAAAAEVVGEDAARAMACEFPRELTAVPADAEAVTVTSSSPPPRTDTGTGSTPARERRPGPEELLVRLVDERVRQLVPGSAPVAGDGGDDVALDYHRQLARTLGGQLYRELYRRVRDDVLAELRAQVSAADEQRAVGR